MWIRTTSSTARKAAMLALFGVCMAGVGLAWNPSFPINKKLWTSPFALFAGGLSMLLLAASIYVVDILRVGRARTQSSRPDSSDHPLLYQPLLVLGTNAILAYLISELGASALGSIHLSSGSSEQNAMQHAIVQMIPSPQWSSLVYSLVYLAICWLLVLPFYRKRIFLKI